jgi:hypothetical protein
MEGEGFYDVFCLFALGCACGIGFRFAGCAGVGFAGDFLLVDTPGFVGCFFNAEPAGFFALGAPQAFFVTFFDGRSIRTIKDQVVLKDFTLCFMTIYFE